MRGECLVGHCLPDAAFHGAWPLCGAVGDYAALPLAVHVEVVCDDELGANGSRGVDDRTLQRRELMLPAVVGGLSGVDNDGAPREGRGQGRFVASVGPRVPDAGRKVAAWLAPGDGASFQVAAGELASEGRP